MKILDLLFNKTGKKLGIVILTVIGLVILSSILLPILLINNSCDHVYDNVCDTTCNECEEIREVSAHDYEVATCITPKTCKVCGATDGEALGHTWVSADCVTPKTCSVCKATEGSALGHAPNEDDGDCTTDIKCSVCGDVTTSAKTNHIAHADDGNCLTSVTCTVCNTVIIEAKEAHDLSGEWLSDVDGHWHACKNDGCTAIVDKTGHTPDRDEATDLAPKKCIHCGYIIKNQLPHTCDYTVKNKNETHHWVECSCGEIDESTKVEHSATDDGDCTTALVCECGHIIINAQDHIAGEDDGNCTTDIKCQNCNQIAESGNQNHIDSDGDYLCDNDGCQVTVGTPPEDNNEGIDLPIDRN